MTTVVVGANEEFSLRFYAIFKALKGIKPNEVLESPIVTLNGYQWSLVASLNDSNGRISFRLKYLGDVEVRVALILSIRKEFNSEDFLISSLPCKSSVHTFSPQNPYSDFVHNWTEPRKNDTKKFDLDSIGNITGSDVIVKTTLTFFEEFRKVPVTKSTLTFDLLAKLKQQPTDIVFIVSEVHIEVHKSLLCARSEIFRSMFETTMKETQTNEIVITDNHVDAVRGFVSYLYSDAIDDTIMKQHALDLLKLSHMYNVEGLNLLCQQHLVTTITNENVFDYLKLADLYTAEYFQKYSAEYIAAHAGKLRNIYGVDVFTTFPEHLTKLIVSKLIDHKLDECQYFLGDSLPEQNVSRGCCVVC